MRTYKGLIICKNAQDIQIMNERDYDDLNKDYEKWICILGSIKFPIQTGEFWWS